MSPKLYLFAFAVILISLSSCDLRNAKPVTNKEETINVLNGSWKPVDSDAKINMIIFAGKNYIMLILQPDGDLKTTTGDWQYTGVGKVKLVKSPYPVTVEIVDDSKLIVNKIMYKREANSSNHSFKIQL